MIETVKKSVFAAALILSSFNCLSGESFEITDMGIFYQQQEDETTHVRLKCTESAICKSARAEIIEVVNKHLQEINKINEGSNDKK